MSPATVKLVGLSLLLSSFFILSVISTIIQYTIISTLYIQDEIITFGVHIFVSSLPSLLAYIYILYGIGFSEDHINPLLPFIVLWQEFIPKKIRLNRTRFYRKYLDTEHSICINILLYFITFAIVMILISVFSQFMTILALIPWSLSLISKQKQNKQPPKNWYNLIIIQLIHMIPNFFMYSAMLFTIPNDEESKLVFLIIIYWIITMVFMMLYVIFCSSREQPSDLIMITELLLLFAALYIALLINYNHNDKMHTISIMMLIFSAIVDGCFMKAIPIREYVEYSQESELYEFTDINPDKLYCLLHHVIYHQEGREREDDDDNNNNNNSDQAIIEKEGYRVVDVKETHEIDSIPCYDLQHQFIRMNKNDKKLHIDKLLNNHLYIKSEKWERKFAQISLNFYWILSIFVAIFPIIWLFYSIFIANPSFIDIYHYHYQDIFVFCVIILYVLMLTITVWTIYMDYERYEIIAKLKQIDNVTHDNAKRLSGMYQKMIVAVAVVDVIQADVAYIILLYVFGDTHLNEKDDSFQEDEWVNYEMNNLL